MGHHQGSRFRTQVVGMIATSSHGASHCASNFINRRGIQGRKMSLLLCVFWPAVDSATGHLGCESGLSVCVQPGSF